MTTISGFLFLLFLVFSAGYFAEAKLSDVSEQYYNLAYLVVASSLSIFLILGIFFIVWIRGDL